MRIACKERTKTTQPAAFLLSVSLLRALSAHAWPEAWLERTMWRAGMESKQRIARSCILLLAVTFSPTPHANFIDLGGTDTPQAFSRKWEWNPVLKGADIFPRPGQQWLNPQPFFWSPISLTASADLPGADPTKNLMLSVTHRVFPYSPPKQPGPPPSGLEQIQLEGFNPVSPFKFAHTAARQFQHNAPGILGWDVVKLGSFFDANNKNIVEAEGKHTGQRNLTWSLHLNGPGTYAVLASYPNNDPQEIKKEFISENDFNQRKNKNGVLDLGGTVPALGKGRVQPTDYEVMFVPDIEFDPITHATLSFLGEADGVPGQLDLALGAYLFAGDDEYVVPMFLADQDLYMAVDLVQYLSNPAQFSIGDMLDFIDGVNPLFPGVLLSNEPTTYDPLTGYSTSNPYTGSALVSGIIDGKSVVPEPLTIALIGIGLAGLAASRRW